MLIATWMTLYGLAGIVSALLAFVIASMKQRDAGTWATWSFFLPPTLLVLMLVGRGNPVVRSQRHIARNLSAMTDD